MNFDRIAPWYGVMETWLAGKCLKRCREAFLDEIPPPEQVLIVGEGRGGFLRAFIAKFPEAEVTVVEASEVMLNIAKRSAENTGKVQFVHSHVEKWSSEERFDLIVTHFMLDCVPEQRLGGVIHHLSSFAKPGAGWLIADFHVAESPLAKLRSKMIIALLYRFFRLVARIESTHLAAWDEALAREGFSLVREKYFSVALLKSEWWIKAGMG